jgi:hypothetical protein
VNVHSVICGICGNPQSRNDDTIIPRLPHEQKWKIIVQRN